MPLLQLSIGSAASLPNPDSPITVSLPATRQPEVLRGHRRCAATSTTSADMLNTAACGTVPLLSYWCSVTGICTALFALWLIHSTGYSCAPSSPDAVYTSPVSLASTSKANSSRFLHMYPCRGLVIVSGCIISSCTA